MKTLTSKSKWMMLLTSSALIVLTQSFVWAQSNVTPANADPNAALRQEVRQLKLELLQQGIEFQTWKIQQLEKELAQVQEKKQRIETQERSAQQRLAEFNSVPTAGGESGEATEMRDTLSQKRMKQISEVQEPVVQQETELLNRLQQERNRLTQLQLRAKRIRASEQ